MKILIIGKGGREHAMAWKFSQDSHVDHIYVAPGNALCTLLSRVSTVNLTDIDELIEFAKDKSIDLTIVGSEELLVNGVVDKFEENGLSIFGPNKKSAQLEGSKAFAKEFMNNYGVKTAKHETFTDYAKALKYLEQVEYPIVVKASGLAAGKGVIIAHDNNEAEAALASMLLDKLFGDSGSEVVIEEYLSGVEASILSFTDSKVILPLISAKDHKKIGEGETGPNTGGMGVIAPNPYVTPEINQLFIRDILEPTLKGLKAEKMDFCGVIFFGVMITDHGVYLLEYNMRMGDPETQAVLPLLKSSLVDVIKAALDKNLASIKLEWKPDATCCVVLASGGYPEHYASGIIINGLTEFAVPNCVIFAAGISKKHDDYITAGGRVLNVVATGKNLDLARKLAYHAVEQISFKDAYYRTDIGKLN